MKTIKKVLHYTKLIIKHFWPMVVFGALGGLIVNLIIRVSQ